MDTGATIQMPPVIHNCHSSSYECVLFCSYLSSISTTSILDEIPYRMSMKAIKKFAEVNLKKMIKAWIKYSASVNNLLPFRSFR
mmetsp:Transcript_20678/g.44888  ORF Transcript_20678/g.44888 Transcript_20678/m.44888 type:complete len:84 (+) Transcript_20678:54-305(+)